jgi:hypothetical protein
MGWLRNIGTDHYRNEEIVISYEFVILCAFVRVKIIPCHYTVFGPTNCTVSNK